MAVVQRIATFGALGALLGDVVVLLVAPRLITWFQAPGVGSALCNCVEVAKGTADQMIQYQVAGMAGGLVGGIVLGEVIARAWAARGAKRAAPAT